MRPLKATLSVPARSRARVSVPTRCVRTQRLECLRLSEALGARQRLPLRSPAAERSSTICSLASRESVKRKLVPCGTLTLAEIAVARLDTRKREWLKRAAVIVGAARASASWGAAAIDTAALALVVLPSASAPVTVTVYVPGAPYACVTLVPDALDPSPTLQL